jgi:hypothetical protein
MMKGAARQGYKNNIQGSTVAKEVMCTVMRAKDCEV